MASVSHTSTKILSLCYVGNIFTNHQGLKILLSLIVYFLSAIYLMCKHSLNTSLSVGFLWPHTTVLGFLWHRQPSFIVSLAGPLSSFLLVNVGMFQNSLSVFVCLFLFFYIPCLLEWSHSVPGLKIAFLCRQFQYLQLQPDFSPELQPYTFNYQRSISTYLHS